MTPEPLACVLCGEEGRDVQMRAIAWAEPDPEPFGYVPRCDRTDECRERVRRSGEPWLATEPQGATR